MYDRISSLNPHRGGSSFVTPSSSPGNKVVHNPFMYYPSDYYTVGWDGQPMSMMMPMPYPMMPVMSQVVSNVASVQGSSENQEIDYTCNVYVKWLSPSITEDGLRQLFNPFGYIKSVRIQKDQYGESKGYGFILFDNAASAHQAIATMSGRLVNDREIHCSLAKRKEKSRMEEIVRHGFVEFEPVETPTPRRYPNSKLKKDHKEKENMKPVAKQPEGKKKHVRIVEPQVSSDEESVELVMEKSHQVSL